MRRRGLRVFAPNMTQAAADGIRARKRTSAPIAKIIRKCSSACANQLRLSSQPAASGVPSLPTSSASNSISGPHVVRQRLLLLRHDAVHLQLLLLSVPPPTTLEAIKDCQNCCVIVVHGIVNQCFDHPMHLLTPLVAAWHLVQFIELRDQLDSHVPTQLPVRALRTRVKLVDKCCVTVVYDVSFTRRRVTAAPSRPWRG